MIKPENINNKEEGYVLLLDAIFGEGSKDVIKIELKGELRKTLNEVLQSLPSPRGIAVLRTRFGLDDGNGKSLREVGNIFNVTRERIRQVEAKTLRMLRHPSRSRKLKPFIGLS